MKRDPSIFQHLRNLSIQLGIVEEEIPNTFLRFPLGAKIKCFHVPTIEHLP
jgi:hypothetical protein